MRKCLILLLVMTLLATCVALAEDVTLILHAPTETVRPGKAVTISFDTPEEGPASIYLVDETGAQLSVVMENLPAVKGQNELWWNGTYQGVPAPEGSYFLSLTQGSLTVTAPVNIGSYAPYLTNIKPSADVASASAPLTVEYYASVEGSLTMGVWVEGAWRSLNTTVIPAGPGSVIFDGAGLAEGEVSLTLTLSDTTGFPSNEEHVKVTIVSAQAEDVPEELPELEAEPADEEAGDEAFDEEFADEEFSEDDFIDEGNGYAFEDEGAEDDADLAEEEPADDEAEELDEQPEKAAFTPAYGSPYNNDDTMNYWTLPMDITDEEAVWEMLMQPMTVVDGNEKTQISLRAEPDENSERVAVVTRATQGVHVLETLDNGWSLVECYSSSFHDSKVKAWNMLVQGYIQTSELKTVKPADAYALVVDKLTQKLYVFKDGGLFSTLDISTGLANERQPYNETRSGEFFLTSAVGGFYSDNMYCPRAIRFNDGDLLHEVPYVERSNGNKVYSTTEPYLGTKASHGCIRVQRKRTPEGVNMLWLWEHRKKNIKIVVWEDWQGRQIPVPEDDLQLYYNAKGGTYYHSQDKCYSAKNNVTFTAFNYSELDTGDFADLKRCPYCAPVLRVEEIAEINAAYAEGGDHDPVMTAARQKYLDGEYDED